MKRGGTVWAAAAAAVLALLLAGGCRKKEIPGAAVPPGETVNINALSEIENYKEILRKDSGNLQAHINIGNLYFDTKQDLLAIEHYQKALALDSRNANVRTDLAVSYRRTGAFDRAVEELKKAISMNPRHAQSRYNLGVILIQDKKDITGGIRAWEALLENIPDYPYRDSLRNEITRMRAILEAGRPQTK